MDCHDFLVAPNMVYNYGDEQVWADTPSFNAWFSPLVNVLTVMNVLALTFHTIEFYRLTKKQRLETPGLICLCGFFGGICRFCYDAFNPPFYSIRYFPPF